MCSVSKMDAPGGSLPWGTRGRRRSGGETEDLLTQVAKCAMLYRDVGVRSCVDSSREIGRRSRDTGRMDELKVDRKPGRGKGDTGRILYAPMQIEEAAARRPGQTASLGSSRQRVWLLHTCPCETKTNKGLPHIFPLFEISFS